MDTVKSNYPRRTIAFYDDNLSFCQEEAKKKHLSVTQYINQLVEAAKAQKDHSPTPTSGGSANVF